MKFLKTAIYSFTALCLSCSQPSKVEESNPINTERIVIETDNGPSIGIKKEALQRLEAYRSEMNDNSAVFHFGRAATEEEIAAWDIDIPPDGHGLPEGSGNVLDGAVIYEAKCAICHSENGEGTKPFGALVANETNGKTIGSYWPYATTIFDYVRRSMPFDSPGSLNDDEVYALTAFLLYRNKIIAEDEVINAANLSKVVMPNVGKFQPDDREKYDLAH